MTTEQHPKIEEIDETVKQEVEVPEGADVHVVANRNERKARKMIQKMGLKKVEGISRVFFRTSRGSMFTISEPDVMMNPSTNTYIIFGEAKMDDHQQNLANLQKVLGQSGAAGSAPGGDAAAAAAAAAAAGGENSDQAPKDQASIQADLEAAVANTSLNDKDDENVGEDIDIEAEGITQENLDLVMSQCGVSKGKAAKALKENKNDIVNAVMSLTT